MGADLSPSDGESAFTALPTSCLVWLWTRCPAQAPENMLDVVQVPQSRPPDLCQKASRVASHAPSERNWMACEPGAFGSTGVNFPFWCQMRERISITISNKGGNSCHKNKASSRWPDPITFFFSFKYRRSIKTAILVIFVHCLIPRT